MLAREFLGVVAEHLPAAAEALGRVFPRAEREGSAAIPAIVGLDPALVARGLYRAWLGRGGRAAFVELDPSLSRGPEDLAPALATVRGGWAWLGPTRRGPGPVPDALLREARQAARAADVRLLFADPDPAGEASPALVAMLARLDAVHAVAIDPTLARVREALVAWCTRGELVYLAGPPGSGREGLARWAHATLGEGPLARVPGAGPSRPGAWWLVSDIDELEPEALAPLASRLAEAEASRDEERPPGARGTPPSDRAFAGIVGRDAALCAVLNDAARFAPTTTPVLVLGETGTGKEPLARALHDASGRKGPFVAIDLRSRGENLVEDDLFGHEQGAFEGARTRREGAARRAHKGTLFFDELGNLSLKQQAQLLRFLQEGEVQALGSDAPQRVDLRVIAATNADLEAMVRAGDFREDLYHRLCGLVLRLPPLRYRGDDIGLLARHFARAKGHPGTFGPDALLAMHAFRWPGNVRQLKQVVEAAVVEAGDGPIERAHLREIGPSTPAPILVTGPPNLPERLELPRALRRALPALTLTLQAPGERGAACLRPALLHRARGRGLTPDALRRLCAWPWWGGFAELGRRMDLLAAGGPGPIDEAEIARMFPEIDGSAGDGPIVVLQHPTVHGGEVFGMQTELRAGAVVVGRARRRAELAPAPVQRPTDAERLRWLDRALGDTSAAFLPFPHLLALSRVHALVSRAGDGLVVTRAPGVSAETRAGPLGGALVSLREGEPVVLGPAGVLEVRHDGAVVLEVFFFRGRAALQESAPLLAMREDRLLETIAGRPALRKWRLDPEEVEWLNAFVVGFVAGEEPDFAPVLRRAVNDPVAGPRGKLREYLDSPHPTQSCGRLYEHRENAPLRADLRRRLQVAGLADRARWRLPTHILTALDRPEEPLPPS